MARSQSDFFKKLIIEGAKVTGDRTTDKHLLSAGLQLSCEQVSELEFVMEDPNYEFLKSFGESGPLGKQAWYDPGLTFRVGGYKTEGGMAGTGQVTWRLRPAGTERLRGIRGPLTRTDLSPTAYVRDAALMNGMQFTGEESPGRPSISRDIPDGDARSDKDEESNTEWSTIQRLAAEEGFLVFEARNVLYFASPKWLFDNLPNHKAMWGGGEPGERIIAAPVSNASNVAATSDDVTFRLGMEKAGEIFPGQTVSIVGYPGLKPKLLITDVTYNLAGPSDLEITAKRPWIIKKREQEGSKKKEEEKKGEETNFGPKGQGAEFYLKEIIAAAKERNLGKEGARNGVATALVESELVMYANERVPESLNYPHDALSYDYDSIGLFQQRDNGAWGTVAQRMNPRASAGLFYNAMMRFDWRSMDPGAACQRVQVSQYPAKYGMRMSEAMAHVNRLW